MSDEKKKNRRTMIVFIAILAASLVLGFLFGVASRVIQNSIPDMQILLNQIMNIMAYVVLILFLIMNLTVAVIGFFYIRTSKKQASVWDGEDEESIEQIEKRLSIPMLLVNAMLVLNFLFFAACIYLGETAELNKLMQDIICNGAIVLFIAGFVIEMILQKQTVDLEKQLNPEKRGNIFDVKFQKVWVNSCDEAQKLMIYKAGYQAFKITNYTCMGVWLLAFIAQFMFHTGIFPTICIGIIWLVLIMTYSITSYKLENKK